MEGNMIFVVEFVLALMCCGVVIVAPFWWAKLNAGFCGIALLFLSLYRG